MRVYSLLGTLACGVVLVGCATSDPPAYLAGTESWVMTSEITGREYQTSVALPHGYAESDQDYSVLYAVDANGGVSSPSVG